MYSRLAGLVMSLYDCILCDQCGQKLCFCPPGPLSVCVNVITKLKSVLEWFVSNNECNNDCKSKGQESFNKLNITRHLWSICNHSWMRIGDCCESWSKSSVNAGGGGASYVQASLLATMLSICRHNTGASGQITEHSWIIRCWGTLQCGFTTLLSADFPERLWSIATGRMLVWITFGQTNH